jgi:hypothetical protein
LYLSKCTVEQQLKKQFSVFYSILPIFVSFCTTVHSDHISYATLKPFFLVHLTDFHCLIIYCLGSLGHRTSKYAWLDISLLILGMKLGSWWYVVNYTDANKYTLIYRKLAAMTLSKFVTQVHALICWMSVDRNTWGRSEK